MSLFDLFRHHEDEVWKQLSDELGGRFENKDGWRQDKVIVQDGPWKVTLDLHSEAGYTSERLYTRFRAPFLNHDRFKMSIYHASIFNFIASMLGIGDVETGHREFDDMFVVKGNDEDRIRQIFAHDDLRELLNTEPEVHISIRHAGGWFGDEFPEDVDELVLEVEGEVVDLERLEKLYRLFSELLHTVVHLDSGYHDDPNLSSLSG